MLPPDYMFHKKMTAIYLFSLVGWAGGGINMLPPNWSDESSLRATNDTFTDLAFSAPQWGQ